MGTPRTQKSDSIISKIKARLKHTIHKYGVELPRNYDHALELDKKIGNNLWQVAYEKEMYNVSISFDFLDHFVKASVSWKRTSGHIVWDVKMEFTRKAR